ncbi:DeoR/GlpR family DNA-binding transcription regulator [Paracoccus sanguinis]|uniref:DeoR/GlpR family DNA-binding transcription regulator n=1 Tax=Paracoccus sanguinis TaxID=1545044 RepID=UPI00051FE7E6|nr:DeoR/GlpR family DNA-binding transcription regulator [Paracoccus sanguinis]KGJ13317.1 DeoR faimly transcriptional regulator [Paracoccus sanguinis]KGJ17666.1 DeoR faimly transcriptional regulator [Paracoccus sanguinis]
MALSIRQMDIVNLAKASGRVEVDDLASRFDVSVQTIRRDLGELADQGLVDRVHGGAVLPSGVANLGYEARRLLHQEAKETVGRLCAARIPDNSSLILNIGTTTEAVARALLGHRNLTVVTNNMNVANIMIHNDSCEVIVAGGAVRRSDGGLVGDLTSELMTNFKVDFAVIGCSAMDADGDVLDYDLAEVRVSRTILRQARSRLLVTDLSKLGRSAPIKVVSLAELDAIVTEAPLPEALRERCAGWETECVSA